MSPLKRVRTTYYSALKTSSKKGRPPCAPPLRSEADKEELIGVLAEGLIDMVSSDHSPCHPSLKREDNMFLSWGGISGGQFTLLGMIQLAIDHGIPFEHVARWTAEAPAKRFGLTNKGRLEEGFDADFAIVRPEPLLSQKKRCFPNISKACMKATPFHTKLSRPTARDAVYQDGGRKQSGAFGTFLKPSEIKEPIL